MVQQLDEYDLTELYKDIPKIKGCKYINEQPHYDRLAKIANDLHFKHTHILVNHNYEAKPHIDTVNTGDTMIISCGNYTGGELVIEGIEYSTFHRPTIFDGCKMTHWVKKIKGDKYSIVFLTKL